MRYVAVLLLVLAVAASGCIDQSHPVMQEFDGNKIRFSSNDAVLTINRAERTYDLVFNASVNYTEMKDKTPRGIDQVVKRVTQKTCTKMEDRLYSKDSWAPVSSGQSFSMNVTNPGTGKDLARNYRMSDSTFSSILENYDAGNVTFIMKSQDGRKLSSCGIDSDGVSVELSDMFNTTPDRELT